MNSEFQFDVFLSYSSKDRDIVRILAEKLKSDGLKVWFDDWQLEPGDNILAKIDEALECSRVLVLCMSANAFGSEWSQLEAGTFRHRDPLNKTRRFIPLRLDDTPIKGSLGQFLYIDWLPEVQDRGYLKLLDACRPPRELAVRTNRNEIFSHKPELEQAKDSPLIQSIFYEPIELSAIPPERLAECLAQVSLSVINNVYVPPQLTTILESPGAIHRIFIGPADCGKTRAAYEWIHSKTAVDQNGWTIAYHKSGAISPHFPEIKIDFADYYDGLRKPHPKNAILFIDDLPNYLSHPGSGATSIGAIRRLLDLFKQYPGFQSFCLVGTARSESMHDLMGWPEALRELGGLRLIKIEQLDTDQQRRLWAGITHGDFYARQGLRSYELEIGDSFLDAIKDVQANPESVATYVRSIVSNRGKSCITEEDASSFSFDTAQMWISLNWETFYTTYGESASIFLSLSRLIEGGAQVDSPFKNNLSPEWEYHEVFGAALLAERGEPNENYIEKLTLMLKDGNASGKLGESIRPVFDFLLQTPKLGDIEVILPSVPWFAEKACNLSPSNEHWISFHFAVAGQPYRQENASIYWLNGQAHAMEYMAEIDPANAVPWFEEGIQIYEQLIRRFKDDTSYTFQALVARAFFKQTYILINGLDRREEALEICDRLMKSFGAARSPEIREYVARSLNEKISTLHSLGRNQEVLEVCEDLIGDFDPNESPEIREQVVIAISSKAWALEDLGRYEASLQLYEDLIERFDPDESPEIRRQVVSAILFKVWTLDDLGRYEEALEVCEDLITRFDHNQWPGSHQVLVNALFYRASTLEKLNRHEEALEVWEDLIKRSNHDESPRIREYVARASFNKAVIVGNLRNREMALKLYDELIDQFGADESAGIQGQVAKAFFSKAVIIGRVTAPKAALQLYDALIERFGQYESLEIREQVAKALFNKALYARRSGRYEEALKLFDEIVRRFSEDKSFAIIKKAAQAHVFKEAIEPLLNQAAHVRWYLKWGGRSILLLIIVGLIYYLFKA